MAQGPELTKQDYICHPIAVPRPLTTRQRSILNFISTSIRDNGVSPSYREIAAHFGITPGGLQKQIKALESKGVLRLPAERSARALHVVGAQQLAGQVRLPILGQVRAGVPVEAIENVEDHVVVDRSIGRRAHFALKIKGDSMEPDMREGDIAVVERTAQATSGESVIAHVGGADATVKVFRKQGREVWLEALNSNYAPIRGQSFTIVGRVRGLIRRYAR